MKIYAICIAKKLYIESKRFGLSYTTTTDLLRAYWFEDEKEAQKFIGMKKILNAQVVEYELSNAESQADEIDTLKSRTARE